MTILSSISSVFGVPNPINALISAVQQAGASNTGSSTAPATSTAAPSSATDALSVTGAPHHHYHHRSSSATSATDAGSTVASGSTGTTTATSVSTNPVNTFVKTLESALATLGASESGAQAVGSGATTLFA